MFVSGYARVTALAACMGVPQCRWYVCCGSGVEIKIIKHTPFYVLAATSTCHLRYVNVPYLFARVLKHIGFPARNYSAEEQGG